MPRTAQSLVVVISCVAAHLRHRVGLRASRGVIDLDKRERQVIFGGAQLQIHRAAGAVDHEGDPVGLRAQPGESPGFCR